jgi:hypothetical protein
MASRSWKFHAAIQSVAKVRASAALRGTGFLLRGIV